MQTSRLIFAAVCAAVLCGCGAMRGNTDMTTPNSVTPVPSSSAIDPASGTTITSPPPR